jgi:hypothetical protein
MQYVLISITYVLALLGYFKDSFPARFKRLIVIITVIKGKW